MSKSTVLDLASQWFGEHTKLAYWIAGKELTNQVRARGMKHYEMDELMQDTVARAYGRFVARCEKRIPKPDERKDWVATCVQFAVKDTIRNKSTFGYDLESDRYAVRSDATSQLRRTELTAEPHTPPDTHPIEDWEIQRVVEREGIPKRLQATALNAAMGLTQRASARRQGVHERTIRNRLRDIREHLSPNVIPNAYATIVAALQAA